MSTSPRTRRKREESDPPLIVEPRPKLTPIGVVVRVLLMLGSLLMIFPFIWMTLGAFKPAEELARSVPSFLPENPTFNNLVRIFGDFGFLTFFLNSLFVTVTTVLLVLFTSSLLGYVFAWPTFRGAKTLFLLILSSMIIPFEVKVVPMFLIIRDLGWVNTYQALIVPFIIDAFGIYLFREFIRGLPPDYLNAARVDGASEWQIYSRIVLPLTRPVFAALAIFSFVFYWDQLIWPIVAVTSDSLKTLPMGIALLSTERGPRFELAFAAAVPAVIPPLLVFLIFQRRIVKGAIMAGLKG